MPGIRQQAFLFKTFEKPRFDFTWHLHPELELTFIRRGHGVRYIGSSILPFYEGDVCLIGSNLPHAYGSHPQQKGPCAWNVIHFLPEVWGEAFWALPENRLVAALLRASRCGLRFYGGGTDAIEEKMAELSREPVGGGRRIPLFLEILQGLARVESCDSLDLGAGAAQVGGTADRRIGQVLRWLEEHAAEKISQAEPARLLGMSTAAFSRFFHRKTGRLFSRHLNEIRVMHACVTLVTTRKSVVEIAFESGFSNLANFNRRFKEVMGLTPSGYRALRTR